MKITLCGSGKFEKTFKEWNKALSLNGHIVYGMSIYASEQGTKDWFTAEQKFILDRVHREKIDNSDAIVVLNVGGYIGESTSREIFHALQNRKEVYFLEALTHQPTFFGHPIHFDIHGLAEELL